MYSTVQLPSLLSLQDILASEGPSMARPRPPVPAPLQDDTPVSSARTSGWGWRSRVRWEGGEQAAGTLGRFAPRSSLTGNGDAEAATGDKGVR